MKKFKVSLIEHHWVDRYYEQEFDCSDQALWMRLKAVADYSWHDVDEAEFPESAPDDPVIWFKLIKICPGPELAETYDDWVSDRKGGYEINYLLEDSEGRTLAEE